MSAPTKERAEAKLAAFTKKIGYPDALGGLLVAGDPDDAPYGADVVAVRTWNASRGIARIGKPTDRARWGMTPPTVNAYYNPSNNEIVFPAGILEPPFFNASADDAVNYGAIGAVIGHEMTHGFDDQGRQFDPKGNLTDWWTPADAANFDQRAKCIVDEYQPSRSRRACTATAARAGRGDRRPRRPDDRVQGVREDARRRRRTR